MSSGLSLCPLGGFTWWLQVFTSSAGGKEAALLASGSLEQGSSAPRALQVETSLSAQPLCRLLSVSDIPQSVLVDSQIVQDWVNSPIPFFPFVSPVRSHSRDWDAAQLARCQSLRAGEDLSGRIWAGFAWQSSRQVVDPSFSVFFPSCRWVKQQSELAKQAENPDQGPKLDLSFKEGQTIKLNIAVRAFAG